MGESLFLPPAALQTVIEQVPVGIWVADGAGRTMFLNSLLAGLTRMSADQFLGRGWTQAIQPEDRDEVVRTWNRARETGTPWRLEYRLGSEDRGDTWVQGEAVPVRDPSGDITLWVGTVTDITDRKAAEARLGDSEALFRAIFEDAPIGIALVSLAAETAGRPIEVNPRLCELLGRSREQLLVSSLYAVSHPDDVERTRADLAAAREGRLPDESTRMKRYVRGDGSTFWGRVTRSRVAISPGDNYYGLALIEDVTVQKEAEDALVTAEARFNAALWDAPVGIALLSLEGIVVDVNPSLCTLLERTRDELLGSDGYDYVHAEDSTAFEALGRRTMRGDFSPFSTDLRLRDSGDGWVWVRITVGLVRNQEGRPEQYLAFFEDATDRREARRRATTAQQIMDKAVWESPVATAVIDPEAFKMVDVNPAMTSFLRCSRDELLSLDLVKLAAFFSETDDDVVRSSLHPRVMPKPAWERHFRLSDGSTAWGRLTSSDIVGPGSGFRRRIVQIEDITPAVVAREAVARSEALMRAAFMASAAAEAVVEATSPGRMTVVCANEAFCAACGVDADQATGRDLASFLGGFVPPPDDTAGVEEQPVSAATGRYVATCTVLAQHDESCRYYSISLRSDT